MDSIKDTEHAPETPNDGSKILDQSDNTSSFSISSENTDSQNLSSNKKDSDDHTNPEEVELSGNKSLSSVGDQLDSNGDLNACGNPDGADLSSITSTVSASDQLDSNGDLNACGNPDGADLSSIKPSVSTSDQLDSNDSLHACGNPDGADLSSITSTASVSDRSDSNDSLHATGSSDGTDLSSIKLSVSTSDQFESNDSLHASGNSGGADLSSIKSTVSTSDQSVSNDKLHASGNPDDADLSSITSTVPVSDQLDNVNLHATGSSEGVDRCSIDPTVSASDRSNSNDNLHASGNSGGAVLSSIKSTVSASDQLDSNDDLHACGTSDGADVSSIKPPVPVSDKFANDCTSILIVNNTNKLYDAPYRLVLPSGIFGNYDNSNSQSQEPQAPMENTGSGVIYNGRTGTCLFPTDDPGNCDFSSDEPWNEKFPKRKSRSSGFFTENIWGSDFSSDNPVSCDFLSDNFSSGKVEYSEDSSNQPQSKDSQKILDSGFSNGKSETCGFSSNMSWKADFSNDKTPMPVSLDVPNEKPVVPKHSNDSLDENSYESGAVTEAFSKLGANSDLLNDNSCSTKESKNSDMSCEIDNAEASSNCFENPMRFSEDLDITDSFAIESSEIPSYLIETSGILGNDPRKSKTEKEINDIYISSCKHPEDESREKFYHDIEVTAADGNWKIEKCHQSTVCVLKRIDENAQYKFKCIYFNKGTKLDELFKNKSHDELNISQDEILECIDSMDEDQLNFIEAPVELNDQSGFLEHRMGTSENKNEIVIADWKIEKCHHSTVFVLKRIDENAQYKFKCIYFNKGTKLDELFKNRSNVDLNVSQEEILDCIDSMKEDQLNFIEDPVESIDQSGFLEDRMGASIEMIEDSVDNELVHKKAKEQIMSIVDKMLNSMKEDQLNFIEDPVESHDQSGFFEDRMSASLEKIDEDLVDNELVHKKARGQIMAMVNKMLNDEFLAMAKNKENLDVAHLDIETREKELAENDILDELKNVLIYDQIYSNKLDVNLENVSNYELIGSQVQDLSGYISSTETNINDSVNETTNSRIELSTFSIQQKMLNSVKVVGETIFSVMLSVLDYFFQRTKSLISTECASAQTIPKTVTDAEDLHSETSSTSEPSTSYTNTKAVSSNNLRKKTRITNFSTLFQHLSATAGTDMTAERVMRDINSQVVMDIYSGFHELRIVDYGSLDLMSQCIKGCIVTLRRTLTHSDPIVQKASALFRKKTHTLEEMRKMNEDLKALTSDAEAHLHGIDSALTGLEDFTDDFMYYKNAISKELVEFLQEDFPEIFN